MACYHAGKDAYSRRKVLQEWSEGAIDIVVATIAFGMGIDRADVRYVIHWNAPSSMEGLYQESGRAGRDGEYSESVVYACQSDLQAMQQVERGLRQGRVAEVGSYLMDGGCRRRRIVKYFGEERLCCQPGEDALCDICQNPAVVRQQANQVRVLTESKAAAIARALAKASGISGGTSSSSSEEQGSGTMAEPGASQALGQDTTKMSPDGTEARDKGIKVVPSTTRSAKIGVPVRGGGRLGRQGMLSRPLSSWQPAAAWVTPRCQRVDEQASTSAPCPATRGPEGGVVEGVGGGQVVKRPRRTDSVVETAGPYPSPHQGGKQEKHDETPQNVFGPCLHEAAGGDQQDDVMKDSRAPVKVVPHLSRRGFVVPFKKANV